MDRALMLNCQQVDIFVCLLGMETCTTCMLELTDGYSYCNMQEMIQSYAQVLLMEIY